MRTILENLILKRSLVVGLVGAGLLILGAEAGRAQLICSAQVDRTTVSSGGTLGLTVTATGSISGSVDFQLPEMDWASVSGSSYSRSQSFSNGQSSLTVAKTYYLTPSGPGEFVIGAVSVSDSRGSCQTDPIKVSVTSTPRVSPQVSGNRVERGTARKSPAGGHAGDDIFITLTADRDTAWVGQQIILTFRYYYRASPWSQPQFTAPRTPGFWREDLGPQQDFRTTVGGRAYNVTEISYAIFPTHAGALTIDPAELSFSDQGLDRFFSSRRRRGPRLLRTDPVQILVKNLPSGQPKGFSGLVASRLQLTATASLDTVPRGEAVDFKVKLVSDAFLKGFEGIKVPAQDGLRVHDASDNLQTNVQNHRLVGQTTLEKVIVPEKEGPVSLPVLTLSWFDTQAERYRVAQTPAKRLMVVASDHPYPQDEDSGFLRNEISRLGQDLVFIHKVPENLRLGHRLLVRSSWWWIGLCSPLLLLGLWKFFLRWRRSDPVLLRQRHALTRALKVLKDPSRPGDEMDFSHRITRAIGCFVADLTNRPLAAVGAEQVREFCSDLDLPEQGQRLVEILEQCDTARYGGLALAGQETALAAEVKAILQGLHRQARSRTSARTSVSGAGPLTGLLLLMLVVGAGRSLATNEASQLMAQGNQAYTDGNLDQALELYQRAEALGVRDPDLYFNLGNTYARRGELGRAVVNFLRARRVAPRDPDIRDNLAWVRGNIKDLELEDSHLPLFVAQIVNLVYLLTLDQWALWLLFLVWLLAMSVGYRWYREKDGDFLRRWVIVLSVCILVAAAVVFWRWRSDEVRRTAVVIVPEETVRSGPDSSFDVQFKVHDGLTVRLQEERGGWVLISLGGESLGWLPASSVEEQNQGR